MKILVTGANGFIGGHLVQHLIAARHDVTAAVRTEGSAPVGSREVVSGEIGPMTDWAGLLEGHECVIHLAARVHVMNDTSAEPLSEFRRVNTAGTEALALAAVDQGVSRFVFLSSIKVNGEATTGVPFSISDVPHPLDPYGISKHEAETGLRRIEARTGLEVVIVRTPLVYGPGVGGNFISLLKIARTGIPLPLGSVRNRRTMTSVWNLVDLLESASSEPAARGALVLAGDPESLSTAQLLRHINKSMGKPDRLIPFPVRLLSFGAAVFGRQSIIERLTGSLEVSVGSSSSDWAWSPPLSAENGVRKTVEWYVESVV
ncbi:UDP-glucose 4-epimerase [Leifsonia rubra CMS 76R]|nr:UDP-glucose 4-epimerase [Leifsonia rubra CMS 76R]